MKVDIDKLALLARIKLTSEEKEKFQKEFGAILGYVSKLKEADVKNMDDEKTGIIDGLENIMREDENHYKAGEFSEDLLKQAPLVEKGYVKVKHILE